MRVWFQTGTLQEGTVVRLAREGKGWQTIVEHFPLLGRSVFAREATEKMEVVREARGPLDARAATELGQRKTLEYDIGYRLDVTTSQALSAMVASFLINFELMTRYCPARIAQLW